jgi:hypothetical protein
MGNAEDRERKEAPQRLSDGSDRSEKAAKLLTNKLGPRGVFRFRSFEEFNKWKDKFGHENSPQDPT